MAQLNGSIAASGIPPKQPANVADRPWFQRLSPHPDLGPGDYHVDEISGKPVVVLSHPVLDNTGRLKFIAFAALDLNWINQVFAAAGLPAGSVMTLSDASGKILARTLDPGKWTGSPGPEAIILKNIAPERDATAESLGVDGVRRLYGFTRLHGRGSQANAYVSVGIPATDAYAGPDRAFPRTLMILALTSALALAALWLAGETFVGRSVRSLGETLQRLQKGDLSARSDARTEAAELRELSRSLDSMADVVQSRAEEHRRSLAAAQESEARLHLALNQLPVLAWSADKDLHVGYMLGGGLNGLKSPEPKDRPSSVSDWFKSIAPDFAPDEPHLKALQGERIAGEIDLAGGGVPYVLAPLRNREGGITGCIGVAWDITARKKLEEALRRKESGLRQCLDSSVAEVVRLKVTLQDVREELKKAQSSAEAAAAEAARFRQEGQVLDQRVRLLEADLENELACSAECKRLESEAREDAHQARAALDAATAEINRRVQMDLEL
jgi:PAS domain-containing protein